ncbi:MAG: vitamin K epoxide reductase family protein [Deltaproteobacteria bacterium]
MRPPTWLVVVLVGAVLGLVFAGVSTYDFVQHLDRQVHSLHCSFIPGVTHSDPTSGCQVAMMSPYSSIFRTHVWGGIPISLGAMSVFAFIAFVAADLVVTRRKDDPKATLFLLASATLPLIVSLVMLSISLSKLGTVCKLCVCIYISSALVFTGAVMTWRRAKQGATVGTSRSGGHRLEVGVASEPATNGFLAAMFGLGCLFVALPVMLYLASAPDNSKFIGTCDALAKPDDTYGVMVNVHRTSPRNAQALEILDPLCPACKAFEQRLEASGLDDKLDRRAILFPLDNTCNWMITETTHPGACTVSEAVLCAGDKAPEVIKWAFEVQDQIRADTAKDPTAAARYVKQKFPELAACVGSPEARSRLNKSLRWSVANNIHVLTPQLFVDGTKLCDEDVDLGLEFALTIMLDRHDKGTLAPKNLPAPAPVPMHSEPAPAPATTKPKASEPTTAPKPEPTTAPADKPAEPTTPTTPAEKPPTPPPPAETPTPTPPADTPVTSPDQGSAQ